LALLQQESAYIASRIDVPPERQTSLQEENMQLKDIMTAEFVDVPAMASVQEAAALMRAHDVGALPVVEHGKLTGIVTDRDITVRATATGKDPVRTTVSEIMSPGVAYTHEDQAIGEATRQMREAKVRRLIVKDREGHPVGVVSLGDLAEAGRSESAVDEALEEISRAEPGRAV
jgi:CBS domain-containing protein